MKKLGMILFGIIFTLLLIEIMVRLLLDYETLHPDYLQSQSMMYVHNHITGVVPAPNQELYFPNLWEMGYDAEYRINGLSYRGDEFSFAKPENTLRVIVMGGSSVFDLVSLHNQDWPHLLQEELGTLEDGTAIEVINAGVPGHATYNSAARLAAESWMFEPDYVMIYNCWNDLKYFTTVDEDSTLLQTREMDLPTLWGQHQRTHFVNGFDEFMGNSEFYLRMRLGLVPNYLTSEATSFVLDLQENYNPEGIAQYALNLRNLVDLSRRVGAEPIFVFEARLPHESNSPELRDSLPYFLVGLGPDALLAAFATCDSTMRQIAEEENVVLIEQTSAMNGNQDYFADHVHTTPLGSQILAQTIAAEMKSRVLSND